MATSDWRGLYTVPEQNYGSIYTNQDDYVLPENKKLNKYYRHRAYVPSEMGEPRPGLKADYGVQASSLGIEDPLSGLPSLAVPAEARMNQVALKKQTIQNPYSEEIRKAGEVFSKFRGVAEDIK